MHLPQRPQRPGTNERRLGKVLHVLQYSPLERELISPKIGLAQKSGCSLQQRGWDHNQEPTYSQQSYFLRDHPTPVQVVNTSREQHCNACDSN